MNLATTRRLGTLPNGKFDQDRRLDVLYLHTHSTRPPVASHARAARYDFNWLPPLDRMLLRRNRFRLLLGEAGAAELRIFWRTLVRSGSL